MKRTARILALVMLLCALTGCQKTYKPQKSTEEESRTVITLRDGEKTYNVPFELYRALRAAHAGEEAERADAGIREDLCRIYAVFALCDEAGYDLYSKETDKTVQEYVRAAVEGGYVAGVTVEGYGSYDAYLASLRALGMNYSVQDLLYRYHIGQSEIEAAMRGTVDTYGNPDRQGTLSYTEEDLRAFYDGEDTARVIYAFFESRLFPKERIEEMRDALEEKAKSGEAAVAAYLIGHTNAGGADVENGHLVAKYNLDPAYFEDLTACAFSLSEGEVGPVIEVATASADGYFLVYRAAKSAENYAAMDDVADVYETNEVGKAIAAKEASLAQTYTVLPALAESIGKGGD